MMRQLKRWLPIAVLAGLLAVALATGAHRQIDLEVLRANREELLAFVAANRLAAVAIFVAIYIAATAVSLPGGAALSVAGGFLFGLWVGTASIVVGATVGAGILFIVARSAFGDGLRGRAGPFLDRMAAGFERHAFSYLLFLRLVPIFPFWAVNLVPALVRLPLGTFIAGTAIGILPGSLVFAAFGAGLGRLFDAGGEARLADVLSAEIMLAFGGLGLLALLPVLRDRLRRVK
jgi:uncharacterized membrane protein YdjX (TVP38/TMEM64 family)